MIKRYYVYSFCGCVVIFLLACSSFKKVFVDYYLLSKRDKKAMQVKVKAPPSYKKGLHKTLDAIWINTQKNSSISYFSSCSDISKDLENFQISSYPQKLNFKVIQKDKTPEFLYSVLELTPLDNPKVYISVYTLRKANCLFNFNLKAPSKQVFDEEEPLFKKMIQDFNLL